MPHLRSTPTVIHVRRGVVIAALWMLASCATPSTSATWSMVEGCWTDSSDAIPPASMIWRFHPAHQGAYLGAWRVSAPYEDTVDFTLEPNGNAMRLCERAYGVAEHCANAVLAGAARSPADGEAVFQVSVTELAFGVADRPAPFFIGRRAACTSASG